MWSELGHWVGTMLRRKERVCVCVGGWMLVRRPECMLLMTKKDLSCFGAQA